jgi:hypothetical protein
LSRIGYSGSAAVQQIPVFLDAAARGPIDQVVDTFYVTGTDGEPARDPAVLAGIEPAVVAALGVSEDGEAVSAPSET